MIFYTIRRILMLIPILIAVSIIVFFLLDLAPGNIVDMMQIENLTQEDYEQLLRDYDLDKTVFYRYGKYMFNLLQGDLGTSDAANLDVWQLYSSRFPNTLLLGISSLIFGSVFGVPLGIFAAKRSGTLVDNAVTFVTIVGMSIPGFWLALLLMLQFSLKWQWLPPGGNEGFRALIMPTICSGLAMMAGTTRQTRSSVLEQLNADYLRTARAKGVPEKVITRKHVLGNAWIPILTTIGGGLSFAIGGSAIMEAVFTWRGVGALAVDAVINRDFTMTMGCTILTTTMFVLIQLLVDLLYALADPRIKSAYARPKIRRRSEA